MEQHILRDISVATKNEKKLSLFMISGKFIVKTILLKLIINVKKKNKQIREHGICT